MGSLARMSTFSLSAFPSQGPGATACKHAEPRTSPGLGKQSPQGAGSHGASKTLAPASALDRWSRLDLPSLTVIVPLLLKCLCVTNPTKKNGLKWIL